MWRVVTAGTLDTIEQSVVCATESAVSQVWLPRCAVTGSCCPARPAPGRVAFPGGRRSAGTLMLPVVRRAARGAGAPRRGALAPKTHYQRNIAYSRAAFSALRYILCNNGMWSIRENPQAQPMRHTLPYDT